MTKEERNAKERANYAKRDKSKKRNAVKRWSEANREYMLEYKRKYYHKMKAALDIYRKEVEGA
jgi:hypothetical protein